MGDKVDFERSVRVEKVGFRKNGVVILTGPSSCGKGEVAAALCTVMSIPPEFHLSMGEILRTTIHQAKNNPEFEKLLADKYKISKTTNIFESVDTSEDLTRKVRNYLPEMERFFNRKDMATFTSQLEWLEFCVINGLLVPNRWTQDFIAAHIESSPELRHSPFILDGYPRTVTAAKHLLEFLKKLNIPVIKVLHLSISKQEMVARALARGRVDDDEASLAARFQFYIESVQPSVDYLKYELGSDSIGLIDAHQPEYDLKDGKKIFNLKRSIVNVLIDSLRSLGVPRVVTRDLLETYERATKPS